VGFPLRLLILLTHLLVLLLLLLLAECFLLDDVVHRDYFLLAEGIRSE
jgi:hypothetical protein